MAASDHLGRQFFHLSDREFEPGEQLRPASETGAQSRWQHLDTYNPNHVYVFAGKKSGSEPWKWRGKMSPDKIGRNVYEVEPHGDPQPDPEGTFKHAYVVPGATVKARVHSEPERPCTKCQIPPGMRGPAWKNHEHNGRPL